MPIVVTLNPELEALLQDKAVRQGQDISLVASQLLANVLQWEEQDSEEAIQGIQHGLDNFEAGNPDRFKILLRNNATSTICDLTDKVPSRNFKWGRGSIKWSQSKRHGVEAGRRK